MTKSDAFFYRLAMPQPFASGEGAELTPILAPSGATGNKVNYADGFPSVYSAPSSNNGKFVTRGQMNAIGNLASQNQFYFLAGGINTFDATFCTSIGGYPEGAVLKYLNNGYLYDVISLIDNNTVDFIAHGVDGVNWMYLSVTEKQVFDDVFFEGGTGATPGTALLGIVKAKKTAGLIITTSLNPVVGTHKQIYMYDGANYTIFSENCGIMIRQLGDSIPDNIPMPTYSLSGNTLIPNWNNWKSLSGDFSWFIASNQTFHGYPQTDAGFLGEVTKDYYYAIALMCANGEAFFNTTVYQIDIIDYESISGTLKLTYAS